LPRCNAPVGDGASREVGCCVMNRVCALGVLTSNDIELMVWSTQQICSNTEAAMERLGSEDIMARLASSELWTLSGEAIQHTFTFDDFLGAMAFVNDVATLAETMGHHPDMLIRWNKVTLTLVTHDAGGLTELDFSLADAIADVFRR
jgi:4a-hydroxytetrahydrobiopterin dehydratase